MYKGRGVWGKTLIHKMSIKVMLCYPSLRLICLYICCIFFYEGLNYNYMALINLHYLLDALPFRLSRKRKVTKLMRVDTLPQC